ncbi:hypothetical protein PSEUBRA_004888 [Kalmanozyma brasiliensis GHG001]|uniref:uncharacterized protein n=1 Tax=Kalmanozyma brasiliensis (strain GHG001) TaxID=1365824 RepID=UPI002867D1EB|nr:uncharacterized protein PSEUBRA_004888 [Kalmanozyma brasiliensis GHG001]KAF6767453.1 hypothetical protein PSEUBRA_004888 [Kalmanozyma brasiliensis GHG001]
MSSSNKQPDSVSNVSGGAAQLALDTSMSDDTMSDVLPSNEATTPTPSTPAAFNHAASEPSAASTADVGAPTNTEPEITDAELRRLTMFLIRKVDEKVKDFEECWEDDGDSCKDMAEYMASSISSLQCYAHQLRKLIVELDPQVEWLARKEQHGWCGWDCKRRSLRREVAKEVKRQAAKEAKRQA